MNKEEFVKECKILGIDITDDMLDKLDKLYHFMIETIPLRLESSI